MSSEPAETKALTDSDISRLSEFQTHAVQLQSYRSSNLQDLKSNLVYAYSKTWVNIMKRLASLDSVEFCNKSYFIKENAEIAQYLWLTSKGPTGKSKSHCDDKAGLVAALRALETSTKDDTSSQSQTSANPN